MSPFNGLMQVKRCTLCCTNGKVLINSQCMHLLQRSQGPIETFAKENNNYDFAVDLNVLYLSDSQQNRQDLMIFAAN